MMIERFCEVYQKLNKDNLETLGLIYHPAIHFVDPAHELHGLPELTSYFKTLYASTTSVNFEFTARIQQGNDIAVEWLMNFSHPRLQQGRTIGVNGMSHLQIDQSGLVDYHRDYFDLGALIYEHLPILGTLIIRLKRRISR